MANVKLSKEEMALVTDAEFILTKNRIIQKVYELFGELSEEYRKPDVSFEDEILAVPPKISKGENYLGLPWVMLDYPRKFSRTDVFAIRSFFWWGKFFSFTLQLQGTYRIKYAPLVNTLQTKTGWWICMDPSDAWQHHFDDRYYIPLSEVRVQRELPFIKLAKKIPLEQWDDVSDFFIDSFKEIITALSAQPVK